jgi:hypothetical protein
MKLVALYTVVFAGIYAGISLGIHELSWWSIPVPYLGGMILFFRKQIKDYFKDNFGGVDDF